MKIIALCLTSTLSSAGLLNSLIYKRLIFGKSILRSSMSAYSSVAEAKLKLSVGILQLNVSADKNSNLERAGAEIDRAAAGSAELVV